MQYKCLFLALGLFALLAATAPSSLDVVEISKREATTSSLSPRAIDLDQLIALLAAVGEILVKILGTVNPLALLGTGGAIEEFNVANIDALLEVLGKFPEDFVVALIKGIVQIIGTVGAIIEALLAIKA